MSGVKLVFKLGKTSSLPPTPTAVIHAPSTSAPTAPTTTAPAPSAKTPVISFSEGCGEKTTTKENSDRVAIADSGSSSISNGKGKGREALVSQTDDIAHMGSKEGEVQRSIKVAQPLVEPSLLEMTEQRDETALSLYRAHKHIFRLREENSALLDRVLLLEAAAGLTNSTIEFAHQHLVLNDRQRDFPLLFPPNLPSLAERARTLAILTTATDVMNPEFSQPVGPAPLPVSLPPRLRSHHLISSIAAQALRESKESRQIAAGLPRSTFGSAAILGANGTLVAREIERVISEGPAGAKAAKEKRKSISEVSQAKAKPLKKGKGAEVHGTAIKIQKTIDSLPNPFDMPPRPATISASIPISATVHNPTHAATTKPAPTLAPTAVSLAIASRADHALLPSSPAAVLVGSDYEMEDYQRSRSHSTASIDEEGRNGATGDVIMARQHRKEEGGPKPPKAKRLKASGITSGTFSIPYIPRNEDGSPKLPLPIGTMVLRNVGHIAVNNTENFSTERYIFPVGYEAMRKYASMIDPNEVVEYVCKIVDAGDGTPRFEIEPSDQPGLAVSASTPTGAWVQIVKVANKIRERAHSNSVSGPDYYGLAQNVVKALIQELPRANTSSGYIWQTFVEDADPGPSGGANDESRSRRTVNGRGKVVGSRRKGKHEMEEGSDYYGMVEAGQHRHPQGLAAAVASSSAVTNRSMSPIGLASSQSQFRLQPEPTFTIDTPLVAPSTLHASATISNPYLLPTSSHLAPSTISSYPTFDPYAIDAPVVAPQTWLPSGLDPQFASVHQQPHQQSDAYELPGPSAPIYDPYLVPAGLAPSSDIDQLHYSTSDAYELPG